MIIPPIRKQDNHGAGHYGAPRGNRQHRGIDLACYPDSVILSDIDGFVSKIGYPYDPTGSKKEYRYIEITDDDHKYRVRYFYVSPLVPVGAQIREFNMIGLAQNLQKVYRNITHHIHVEVLQDGKHINPAEFLEGY